jgi:hypothetical protein
MMKPDPREELLFNPRPGTAAAAARDFGIDLTLTVENLRLTPEERVRRLDEHIDGMKRLTASIRWLQKSTDPPHERLIDERS